MLYCPLVPDRRRLARPGAVLAIRPLLDILERRDGFHLYCNLPGVTPEDIFLELDGDVLSLKASARLFPVAGKVHALEFSDIVYEARLRLPPTVDARRVTADFDNGCLCVTLPFPDAEGRVRIPVIRG